MYTRTNPRNQEDRKLLGTWESLFDPRIEFAETGYSGRVRDSLSTIVFSIAISGIAAYTWLITFTEFRDHRFSEVIAQVLLFGVFTSLVVVSIKEIIGLAEQDEQVNSRTYGRTPISVGEGEVTFLAQIQGSVLARIEKGGTNPTGQQWRPLRDEKTGLVMVIITVGGLTAAGCLIVLLLY